MVYDYALWRDDKAFVESMIPGTRSIIDAYLSYLNDDDLIMNPKGWNFMDWLAEWESGVPPDHPRE